MVGLVVVGRLKVPKLYVGKKFDGMGRGHVRGPLWLCETDRRTLRNEMSYDPAVVIRSGERMFTNDAISNAFTLHYRMVNDSRPTAVLLLDLHDMENPELLFRSDMVLQKSAPGHVHSVPRFGVR